MRHAVSEYRIQLAILGILGLLLLAISLYAHGTKRFPPDLYLALRIQSLDGNSLVEATRWISYLFSGWRAASVVLAITLVLLWRAGPIEAAVMVVAGAANLLNIVFKLAVNRARPGADLLQVLTEETSSGFPSGHACFSVLILGLLVYFVLVYIKSIIAKSLLVSALILWILAVGFSRIYLGVHWPSDVLGGYMAGGFLLAFVIFFYRVLKKDAQVHQLRWSHQWWR